MTAQYVQRTLNRELFILSPSQTRPVVHSKIIVLAHWRKHTNEPCTIKWILIPASPCWIVLMANPKAKVKRSSPGKRKTLSQNIICWFLYLHWAYNYSQGITYQRMLCFLLRKYKVFPDLSSISHFNYVITSKLTFWIRNVVVLCSLNASGDILVLPAQILPKYTLTSSINVLTVVKGKVQLHAGAVPR